ncbi:MAG: hypothetical protein GAK32_01002 [Pseudomonas fluorescens]|nr:MAG: hypothetical protein GAK32_01002 [Pseudomonas fluorescens]
MPALEPPYFFDEFLLPVKRDQPSARERALGLTIKDLDWMHTLYYATDSARQNTRLRGDAMQVDKFFVTADSTFSAPLAGIFMMSPSPDASKAVLYTPYGGLEVFESRQSAIDTLEGRLKTPSSLQELTRFLSIPSRKTLFAGKILKVSTATIDGAVLEDQEQTLQASLQENMRAMLDELRKIPVLSGMLDTLLAIMARSYFPGLNQRDTRMNSYL